MDGRRQPCCACPALRAASFLAAFAVALAFGFFCCFLGAPRVFSPAIVVPPFACVPAPGQPWLMLSGGGLLNRFVTPSGREYRSPGRDRRGPGEQCHARYF